MHEGRRRGTLGHRGRSPSPLLRVLLLRTPSQSSDPTAVALELVKVSSPIPLSPSLIFGRLGSLMRFSHAMRVPTSRSVVRTLAAAPWHCGCQRCLSCGSKGGGERFRLPQSASTAPMLESVLQPDPLSPSSSDLRVQSINADFSCRAWWGW